MISAQGIIDHRFFVGSFQFEDYGPQAVITAADGDARFSDPVSVVEQFRLQTV